MNEVQDMTDEEVQTEIAQRLQANAVGQRLPASEPKPVESMTDEEVAAELQAKGYSPQSLKPIESMTDEEVRAEIAQRQQAQPSFNDKMNWAEVEERDHPNETLAAKFQDPVSATNTGFGNALDYAYNYSDRGVVSKFFYSLGIPGQAVARQAVNVMQSIGYMTPQDAKKLLSRDELYSSDIMKFYWREPNTLGERVIRGAVGLAMDIALDPLSVAAFGLNEAGKTAVIGSKTYAGLNNLSKAERATLRGAESVSHVLTNEAKLIEAKVPNLFEENIKLTQQLGEGKINFGDFQKKVNTMMSPKDLETAYQEGIKGRSFLGEIASGQRSLSLGVNIPFTKVGVEFEVPILTPIAKWGASQMGEYGPRIAQTANRLTGGYYNKVVKGASEVLDMFSSSTGHPIADEAMQDLIGAKNVTLDTASEYNKEWRPVFKSMFKGMNEVQKQQVVDGITNSVELTHEKPIEELMQAFGSKADSKYISLNTKQSEALKNAELVLPPEAKEFVADTKNKMRQISDAYAQRPGIAFEPLNPFGEGWAKGYLKHIYSDEYLQRFKNIDVAHNYALEHLGAQTGAKVEKSLMGRAYRGTIAEANAGEVKMFVDDPIELVTRRMLEADATIRKYDFMDKIKSIGVRAENAAEEAALYENGYVKFDPNHFKESVLDLKFNDSEFAKGSESKYAVFLPDFYKTDTPIFFPEKVYGRALDAVGNSQKYFKLPDLVTDTWKVINHVFINSALTGLGYLGMNQFSNTLAYLSRMSWRGLTSLVDTNLGFMGIKKEFDILNRATGLPYKFDELWTDALKLSIVKSSPVAEMGMADMAESVASGFKARQTVLEKTGKKLAKVGDIANFWALNRHISQYSDDSFKFALWIDKMKQGLSPKGAAESVELAFPNFQAKSPIQKTLGEITAFSSFPLKQIESFVNQVKTTELGVLTLPTKVSHMLQGAYVPDPETRQAIRNGLPGYMDTSFDRLVGPFLPGQRQVLFEMPWAQASIGYIFDPASNLHPVFQVLASAATQRNEKDYNDLGINEGDFWDKAWKFVSPALPFWMKDGLAIAAINGHQELEFFAKQYSPMLPVNDPTKKLFDNSVDFGAYLEKTHSNALYNLFFTGKIESPDDPKSDKDEFALARRGEFIRKHFRNLSLGLATISQMDRNFFLNYGAMERQSRKLKSQMVQELEKAGYLVDEKAFDSEKELEVMAKTNPKAANILAIKDHQKTLKDWQNSYYEMEEKLVNQPGVNPLELLFGNFRYGKWERPQIFESGDEYPISLKRQQELSRQEMNADLLDEQLDALKKQANPQPESTQAPIENPDN